MKPILLLVVLAAVSVAWSQSEKPTLKRPIVAPNVGAQPVTRAEAKKAFTRADAVIRRSLFLGGTATSGVKGETGAITREEVVAELMRLYGVVRPKTTLSPRPVKFDSMRFRIGPSAKVSLAMLVKIGAVAPFGPLATGPKNSLTVPEFGDALGFFISRMAEITYLPSRKWTPVLQDK